VSDRLKWSVLAVEDRETIFDYVATDDPSAAISLDDLLVTQALDLVNFPERGRPGRITGTRELVVSGTPYIIAYKVAANGVRILRLLHGARRWPDDLGDTNA
jgi:addiction module RelE/StbE family toxin